MALILNIQEKVRGASIRPINLCGVKSVEEVFQLKSILRAALPGLPPNPEVGLPLSRGKPHIIP